MHGVLKLRTRLSNWSVLLGLIAVHACLYYVRTQCTKLALCLLSVRRSTGKLVHRSPFAGQLHVEGGGGVGAASPAAQGVRVGMAKGEWVGWRLGAWHGMGLRVGRGEVRCNCIISDRWIGETCTAELVFCYRRDAGLHQCDLTGSTSTERVFSFGFFGCIMISEQKLIKGTEIVVMPFTTGEVKPIPRQFPMILVLPI
jgi:hypothetical protein